MTPRVLRPRAWARWIRDLVSSRRREQELDDEIRSHLELEVAGHVAAGMTPDEAWRLARRDFGGVERFKEECRDARPTRWAQDFARDLGFGWRVLGRAPSYTVAALVTLALGIGGTAAVFGALRTLLLQPLPYRSSGELVFVWQRDLRSGADRLEASPANFLDWRARSRSFSRLSAAEPSGLTWSSDRGPVFLPTWVVYDGFFDLLGTRALLGRTFRDEEYRAGHGDVLVLGHRIWKQRFGGDSSVVGNRIEVDGRTWTIVGVMPESFAIPSNESVWAPKMLQGWEARARAGGWYTVVGRLTPGTGPAQAAAEMTALGAQLAREHPVDNAGIGVSLVAFDEQILGRLRSPLLVLVAAVVVVFLIACANLANLQLTRAVRRAHEFALRSALGAPRGRLVRQLLTESALLVGLGCLLGFAVADLGLDVIRRIAPADLPRLSEFRADGWVLAFCVAAALLAGMLTGIAPIRVAERAGLRGGMASGGTPVTAGRTARRLRDALVVLQIALSFVLLVGAGLLLRSFVRLLDEDRGFRTAGIVTCVVHSWDYVEGAAGLNAFVRRASERLGALPGVQSVAVGSAVPTADAIGAEEATFSVVGSDEAPGTSHPADVNLVTAAYFSTLDVRVRRGRAFDDGDREGAEPVAVVSDGLARRRFGVQDPVGRRLQVSFQGRTRDVRIVGVAGDVRRRALDVAPQPTIYLPLPQVPTGSNAFFVRARSNPDAVLREAKKVFHELMPEMPLTTEDRLDRIVGESVRERRFLLILVAAFAGLALALAIVGTFGVMSYGTAERTREIGIRIAFGAVERDVVALVLGHGLRLAALGVGLGLAGAVALTRLLEGLLYGVRPLDAATYLACGALLLVAAGLACWAPASRAARLDPMTAVRLE